jgi:hypothetical protein
MAYAVFSFLLTHPIGTFYSVSAFSCQQTLIELLIVNMQRMNGGEKKSTGRNSRGKR